uniref:Uncharacterized protein n=1 Tax=Arundo donax TaxID=35708 RepID=A0A0A9HDR5_ARUDO
MCSLIRGDTACSRTSPVHASARGWFNRVLDFY